MSSHDDKKKKKKNLKINKNLEKKKGSKKNIVMCSEFQVQVPYIHLIHLIHLSILPIDFPKHQSIY